MQITRSIILQVPVLFTELILPQQTLMLQVKLLDCMADLLLQEHIPTVFMVKVQVLKKIIMVYIL